MAATYLQVLALLAWLALLARSGGRSAIRDTLRGATFRAPRPLRMLAERVDWIGAAGLIAVGAWLTLSDARPSVVDATVYWRLDLDRLYDESVVNRVGAYLYSPVFAQVGEPFTFLRWTVWYGAWTAINLVALGWVLGPAAALMTLAFPLVGNALWSGNIHFLMAAAAVLAISFPVAWGFPLLTKVTPGVGILWHAGRREWRALAVGLAATAAIATVSFLVAPDLWRAWLEVLGRSSDASPVGTLLPLALPIRLVLAAAVAVVGGMRGWAWTIPVAMVIAQPVFWTAGLVVLIAVVPLSRPRVAPAWSTAAAREGSSSAARQG